MKRDYDYIYPTRITATSDDFADHVARGSVLPGLDFLTATGTKLKAASKGIVILADGYSNQVRGKNIIIKHPDGNETHYLHLSAVSVRNGQRVKMGDLIGLTGNTGTTTTGPHLHFAIKGKNGKCFDPAPLLRKEAKEAAAEAEADSAEL